LRKARRPREALVAARAGLSLLGQPKVQRFRPVEATAITFLTVLAEEIGSKLQRPGAFRRDLRDTLRILRGIQGQIQRFPQKARAEPAISKRLRRKWIPYLEARVLKSSRSTLRCRTKG
jgi:hypothetical protein